MASLSGSHAAGDVLMIQPSNLSDVVEEFISFLGLDSYRMFTLEQRDPGKYLMILFIFLCW